jgi:hypothetical protein
MQSFAVQQKFFPDYFLYTKEGDILVSSLLDFISIIDDYPNHLNIQKVTYHNSEVADNHLNNDEKNPNHSTPQKAEEVIHENSIDNNPDDDDEYEYEEEEDSNYEEELANYLEETCRSQKNFYISQLRNIRKISFFNLKHIASLLKSFSKLKLLIR